MLIVSAAGNHTSPRHLQHSIEQGKAKGKIRDSPRNRQKILDEKLITTVQICLRCGRKLPSKRGRKRCPSCQGLLRIKTMILKVPQF